MEIRHKIIENSTLKFLLLSSFFVLFYTGSGWGKKVKPDFMPYLHSQSDHSNSKQMMGVQLCSEDIIFLSQGLRKELKTINSLLDTYETEAPGS